MTTSDIADQAIDTAQLCRDCKHADYYNYNGRWLIKLLTHVN